MKHLLLVLLAMISYSLQKTMAQESILPIDPKVRIGKLDNGLTYYIRKNALPENRADFYFAQKVGSIQEESNQLGLAHFWNTCVSMVLHISQVIPLNNISNG